MQTTQGLYGQKKVKLGLFPTPMHRLENISRILGVEVWIKRDDLCGVALGGNKVRKLEYLLCDAIRQGCRLVMTTGQAQSNHAMLTAACARRLGLEPVLVLKKRGVTECRGNQVLNRMLNAEVQLMDAASYDEIYAEMDRIAVRLRMKGYKIPCGGSNALGSLGYAECVREIVESGVSFDHLMMACGSGGTAAGICFGAAQWLPDSRVWAMMVDTDPFDRIVGQVIADMKRLTETAQDVGLPEFVDVSGPGYSIPSEEGREAAKLMMQQEGIVLDPCYTGKAFAGLLRCVREGRCKPGERVLFIHTGGAGGLFAQDWEHQLL